MLYFKEIRDQHDKISHIETAMSGFKILNAAKLNKGSAFSEKERIDFNLIGKLSCAIETLEQQANRIYHQYLEKANNLQKNIYLNTLHDTNETLFFAVISQHLKEMLPVIYTPTVGEAVERFSLELRKSRGLYISYPEIEHVEMILENRLNPDVDLIVVTDGEGVLGIGDQGIGGMDICIAKLAVYTLCGGIHPHHVIPIQLDVGTNNKKLLDDPMYLGWRHERISGKEYDDFISQFVTAVQKKFPHVYLHWEDFGRDNARKNLNRYRDHMCTFNDDMQGTGAVTLACILAGVKATQTEITDQRVVIFGGGTAGCGIADQIKDAMIRSGLTEQQANQRFWIIDREGLLINDMKGLLFFQEPYARTREELTNWEVANSKNINLFDVVRHVKPTILIGCSTVTGAFSEEIIKEMAKNVHQPIILPLSNPTSKAEATPQNIIQWTDGRALIATGSPFGPVDYNGKTYEIAQSNNALVFPGLGLGVICAKAARVHDNMIWAACSTLSDHAPVLKDRTKPLLPDINDARMISRSIAIAVAKQAIQDGLANIDEKSDIEEIINNAMWQPQYYPYVKVTDDALK